MPNAIEKLRRGERGTDPLFAPVISTVDDIVLQARSLECKSSYRWGGYNKSLRHIEDFLLYSYLQYSTSTGVST